METRELHIRKIEDRTVEFVISDGSIDAHGTILTPGGWDLTRFNKNGIFGYQHRIHDDVNPDMVLGPASAHIEGNQLIGRATFETEDINPLAEKIYKKVKNGTLKAVSVGFIPKRHHLEKDVLVYDEQELIEFSIVNIPSNPKVVKSSKSAERKRKRKLVNILNYL